MNERTTGHKIEWKKVEGIGANVTRVPLDHDILKQEIVSGSTFLSVSPIGLIIHDIKKALHPDKEIPY